MHNLTTDAFLPVTKLDGTKDKLSLNEVFNQSDKLAPILDLPALDNIAWMRMLILLAQRALGGPKDQFEKCKCRKNIKSAAANYLKTWKDAFDEDKFGQVQGLQLAPQTEEADDEDDEDAEEGMLSVEDLDTSHSLGGNGPSFFDPEKGMPHRMPSWDERIRMLLSYQLFYGGGRGSKNWRIDNYFSDDKAEMKKLNNKHGSNKGGPGAGRQLHAFWMGETLLDTIWLNMIPYTDAKRLGELGYPYWENMPKKYEDGLKNANTFYGRGVPLVEALLLVGDKFIRQHAYSYLPDENDPFRSNIAVYTFTKAGKFKKMEFEPQKINAETHPWRSACSLLSFDSIGNAPVKMDNIQPPKGVEKDFQIRQHFASVNIRSGAAILEQMIEDSKGKNSMLWVGGCPKLADKEAVPAMGMEWSLTFPAEAFLGKDAYTANLSKSVAQAEKVANILAFQLKLYKASYKGKPDPEPKRRSLPSSVVNMAMTLYWNDLNRASYQTLKDSALDSHSNQWKAKLHQIVERTIDKTISEGNVKALQAKVKVNSVMRGFIEKMD